MKRYRLLNIDFDGRSNVLWTPDSKLNAARDMVIEQMKGQYGLTDFASKLQRYTELGMSPWSIIAYHNQFLAQVRDAYVMGAYYPALTGACAMGERILNHLWLGLQSEYAIPARFRNNGALNNWSHLAGILTGWGILLPKAKKMIMKLEDARQKSIHFRPSVDLDKQSKPRALAAIKMLQGFIREQFSSYGEFPWYITGVYNEIYIKKEWEASPYIKLLYLPHCSLVGPQHVIRGANPWRAEDKTNLIGEVTDAEFVKLRRKHLGLHPTINPAKRIHVNSPKKPATSTP